MNIQIEAAPLPKLPIIDQTELDAYIDTIRLNASRIDDALKGSNFHTEWIVNTTYVDDWCCIYPDYTDSCEEFEAVLKQSTSMMNELKQQMNWCAPLVIWGIVGRACKHGSKSIEPFTVDDSR